ncbi:MAG TPA: TIGR03118 family protein [Gaiellaceae bacterium]
MRRAAVAVAAVAAAAVAATLALGGSRASGEYAVDRLVSDGGVPAARHDAHLVNAWGLAAEPGGVWWTANEANDTSTLYSAQGRKQLLTVAVDGGPTGIAYSGGNGFRVSAGGTSAPARFVFACEDGTLRAWSPVVPRGWSRRSEVVVDDGAIAAVFRGVAIAGDRLYATDFHNARVDVFDSDWHRIVRADAFTDPSIPAWYAPFGVSVIDGHVFVTYVWRAPVDGNDAPTGGYVDEYDLDGRLLRHVGALGHLNAPWGLALAPGSFGRYGGDLLVGNFGDGRINAFRFSHNAWAFDGTLRGRNGKPLVLNGLWALAFGKGGGTGAADRLFFSSGPHAWRGPTELQVHGLIGSIAPA